MVVCNTCNAIQCNAYIIWYGSVHFQKDSFTLGKSLFPKVKRLLKHFKNLLLNTYTSEGRLIHMHIVVDFYLVLQAVQGKKHR